MKKEILGSATLILGNDRGGTATARVAIDDGGRVTLDLDMAFQVALARVYPRPREAVLALAPVLARWMSPGLKTDFKVVETDEPIVVVGGGEA